jgi:hypothetical protein
MGNLTSMQKAILWAGVVALGLLTVIVPWNYTFDNGHLRSEKPAGYRLIFDPPMPEQKHPAYGVKADVSRAMIPMGFVVLAMVVAVLCLRPRNSG